MTEPLADLRTTRAPYRKHSANKAWTLEVEEPVASYRDIMAQQTRETVSEDEPVSDVLRRFYARLRCDVCHGFVWCEHRDRKADVELVLRGKRAE